MVETVGRWCERRSWSEHGNTMCVENTKGDMPKVYNKHDLTAKRNEWHFTPPAPVTSYLKSIIKVRALHMLCQLLVVEGCMCGMLTAVLFTPGRARSPYRIPPPQRRMHDPAGYHPHISDTAIWCHVLLCDHSNGLQPRCVQLLESCFIRGPTG